MDTKEIPPQLREDNLSQETKTLISSLPSNQDSIGKLYNYERCWYYGNTLQGVLNFQSSFKPQDTDIILASLPKSGTTWLKALTVALMERSKHRSDDHPLLSHNPHDLVPFLEGLFLKSSKPDFTKFLSSSSPPRLFGTHLPLHTLRVPLKNSLCKIVYVCRNVKDVAVSRWYFMSFYQQKEVDKKNLDSMVESLCKGVSYYGPFWEHVLSYWKGSLEDSKHVLFMRYEEMKADPFLQVKRLAEFLDCPFTVEEEQSGSIDKILELCSLSNLKGLEINKSGQTTISLPNNSFFRKGEVGDSKNHLTPMMENKIDMIVEEKYKDSGLKF